MRNPSTLTREMDAVTREIRAIKSTRVRFARVNAGPNLYSAEVLIDGTHYATVSQRRGGDYEAFVQGRRIASAPRLAVLRERIVRHYLDGSSAPQTQVNLGASPAVA